MTTIFLTLLAIGVIVVPGIFMGDKASDKKMTGKVSRHWQSGIVRDRLRT